MRMEKETEALIREIVSLLRKLTPDQVRSVLIFALQKI